MGESQFHIDLVRELHKFAREIRPEDTDGAIYVDLPDVNAAGRPQKIGNSRPDLAARWHNNPLSVIGEAKTAKGLEGPHTVDQLRDFIEHLLRQPNPLLVMATPWLVANRAATMIRRELRRLDANVIRFEIIRSNLE